MLVPSAVLNPGACRRALLALPPALFALALGLGACGPVYRSGGLGGHGQNLQPIGSFAWIASPVGAAGVERQRA